MSVNKQRKLSTFAKRRTRNDKGQFVKLPKVTDTYAGSAYGVGHQRILPVNDDALRDDSESLRRMMYDPAVSAPLKQRLLATAGLEHTVDPPDPNDPDQVEIAEQLHAQVEAIPYLTEYFLAALDGIWVGRSAIINDYQIAPDGKMYIANWRHLQGDKLAFTNDGKIGYRIGSPINPDNVLYGPMGRVELIDDDQREAFVIHAVGRQDGWFHRPWEAASIYGTGLRETVYWLWRFKQETMASLSEAINRFGVGGLLVAYFQAGNDASRDAVVDALEKMESENYKIALPSMGGDDIEKFEVISPGGEGAQGIYSLVQDWNNQIRLAITHNLATADAVSTGLGSSVGDQHANTFGRLIQYDARSLAETLTRDLVKVLLRYNFPQYQDLDFRFRFITDEQDIAQQLELAKQLKELGVSLNLDELRDLAGFSAPEPTETNTDTLNTPSDIERDDDTK